MVIDGFLLLDSSGRPGASRRENQGFLFLRNLGYQSAKSLKVFCC